MRKKDLKNRSKGITLIALVITIIVLLILAGVSIAMLTGENGILTQATNAKEATEKASLIEQAQTDLLGKQVENSSGNVTSEALKEVLDKYFSDVPEADEITVETPITSKEEYGKYKMQVSDIYDGEIKGSSIPAGLEIGSTVSYSPSGEYTWEANYYNSPSSSSYTDVTLDSSASGDFNINTWKVLEIDREAEKVTLVPASPTTGTVRLRGAQGYNNGVYLLNEACSKLYGNDKGITARSMNIEDIEKYMTDEAKNGENGAYKYNNGNATYGEQTGSAYTSNKYYPIIYAKEKSSVINGTENTSGLGMSEQNTPPIGRTEGGATSGYINATTSIQPYQTYWYKDSSFMEAAFKDVENSSSASNYYNLIMPKGTSTTYWLASRCVNTNSSFCYFNVRYVDGGDVNAYIMFSSSNGTNGSSLALFPVVSLSSEFIEKTAEEGYTVTVE